jgi:L-histidine Nalpha-methyltransferase
MSINSNAVVYRAAVLAEAIKGLLGQPKTLAPWLFYDAEGSLLFEQITALPEY